jgi:molybdopterin converting factor small subunit
MKLTVKLFAHFRDNRFVTEVQEYPDGITIGEIVDRLDIDRDDIGITMINSKHCGFADTLSEDDTLAIFPLVGGG